MNARFFYGNICRKIANNYFLLSLIIFCLLIGITAYRSGAPVGTTNAPGETTCATNGLCHIDGLPNNGPGFAEITIMGGVPAQGYTPWKTYTIMPYMVDSSTITGFQTVALLSNGKLAGNVTITNPVNTQMITGGSKEYVQQTHTGSTVSGMHDWMYDWQAPPPGSGNVVIYGAFIGSDGDGSARGDSVYTDTLLLIEGPASGIWDQTNISGRIINIFPQPSGDMVNIELQCGLQNEFEVTLFDMNGISILKGKLVYLNSNKYNSILSLTDIPPGTYLVRISNNEQFNAYKKLIKI